MTRPLAAMLVMSLSALLPQVISVPPATAESSVCRHCEDAQGQGGTIVVRGRSGKSDTVPGRGDGTQGKPAEPRDWYEINEYVTPTCSGNELNGDDVLCGAAVNTCPAADQIRFWIWHQRVDHYVGPPPRVVEGPWVKEDGAFCLGPDDPGVPSIVNTLARARDVFEQKVQALGLPVVKTSPGPRTLVNYDTDFEVRNAEPFAVDVPVAGTVVHLDVKPLQFTWTYGDGTTERTTTATSVHTYDRTGRMPTKVDVVWGGTFTVGAQAEAYDIDPPATVNGAPTVLTVVQARAENVS